MDIDPGSILTNRGLNGYGYGMQGGFGNGHANFPGDGSVVNANVEANRVIGLSDSINRTTTDAFLSNQVSRGQDNIIGNVNRGHDNLTAQLQRDHSDSHFATITSQFATLERITIANKADTDRQLHAMELKQVECCCELKAGQATIIAKLDSDRAAASERENDNLRLQIQIINQGRGNQGGGNGGS